MSSELKKQTKRKRRIDALNRLDVEEDDFLSVPQISPILKQAKGGLKAVLAAMRVSNDPSIRSFLDLYDQIPSRDRESIPWEAICLKAGISTPNLLGATLICIHQYNLAISKLIAVTNHTDVVKTRIRVAKENHGYKDRDALDLEVGFSPTPKGTSNNFFFGSFAPNPSAPKGDDDDDEESEVEIAGDLPLASQDIDSWSDIRAKMLTSGDK